MRLKNIYPLLLLVLYIFNSCNQQISSSLSTWQFFTGRDDGQSFERSLLYRARVPSHWIRQDPSKKESIADTTKAICEFYIRENDQQIRLTIHTFPILQDQLRIPPQAQIARWKGQFEKLDLIATHVESDAHGGFSGLYFEGEGILRGKLTKIIGWSMQLAPLYAQQLSQRKQALDTQKRADYTIKASGPPHLMHQHYAEILAFARSFELIDELPFLL